MATHYFHCLLKLQRSEAKWFITEKLIVIIAAGDTGEVINNGEIIEEVVCEKKLDNFWKSKDISAQNGAKLW